MKNDAPPPPATCQCGHGWDHHRSHPNGYSETDGYSCGFLCRCARYAPSANMGGLSERDLNRAAEWGGAIGNDSIPALARDFSDVRSEGATQAVDTLRTENARLRAELAQVNAILDQNADRALRAENARLRAALAEATATLEAWHVGNAGHMCADPGWRVAMQDETGRQLNRARAALDGAR